MGGTTNPGKSLPRGAVKFSRSGPEANRSDSAGSPLKPQNGRVQGESSRVPPQPPTPATHTRSDRKRGAGSAVCSSDLTFPLPAPRPRTWHPRRPDTHGPARPGRPARDRVGAVTLSDRALRPLPAPGWVPGSSPVPVLPSRGSPKPTFRANFSCVLLLKICKTFPLMPSPRTWVVTL